VSAWTVLCILSIVFCYPNVMLYPICLVYGQVLPQYYVYFIHSYNHINMIKKPCPTFSCLHLKHHLHAHFVICPHFHWVRINIAFITPLCTKIYMIIIILPFLQVNDKLYTALPAGDIPQCNNGPWFMWWLSFWGEELLIDWPWGRQKLDVL
jgi:hypothetical protein